MDTTARRGHLAGPVLLIGFGTLVLLVNMARIPVGLWSALIRLWPLALIVLGLDLLIPRRSVLASVLVAALLLGVMFGGAALALPAVEGATVAGGEDVSVPIAGEAQAALTFLPAASDFRLDSTASTETLLTGVVRLPAHAQLATSSKTVGGRALVELKTVGSAIPVIYVGTTAEEWRMHVSTEPIVAITVNQGAGEAIIDGRRLKLESVTSTVGAGRIEVWLPAGARANLTAAVGELAVHVPRGASVVLRPTTALGGTQVPAGYVRVGDEYRSPGYQAEKAIMIDASVPLGGVVLTEY